MSTPHAAPSGSYNSVAIWLHRCKFSAMDSVLYQAARALGDFQPLLALKGIALRNDAEALALRGIAMSQLGDFVLAQKLLKQALGTFGENEPLGRARCLAALAEVALARRDAASAERDLDAAARLLEEHRDHDNALFTRLQLVRLRLLLGEPERAELALDALDLRGASTRVKGLSELVRAALAVRNLEAKKARVCLQRAYVAARATRIAPLLNEVVRAAQDLDAPVARIQSADGEKLLTLGDIEILFGTKTLIVDACQRGVRVSGHRISLRTRPTLFALATELGAAFPNAATRDQLVIAAFGARRVNDSLRARLRVECVRLRRLLAKVASIEATPEGFRLVPSKGQSVVVLLPPEGNEGSELLALLRDGDSWSTSALATALGKSQRSVQRTLQELTSTNKARSFGRGRGQRWTLASPSAFATTLLLAAREATE